MKKQVKVVLLTVSVLVLVVALAFLAACVQKSGETAKVKEPTAAVEIADETVPLASPAVQAEAEEAEEAAPAAEQVVAIANEEPIAVPAVNSNRQMIAEVTEPKVTKPEVTKPEVTEPEVTDPETSEPEQSIAKSGVAALWNSLFTEGSTAYRYFATRGKGASMDSTGANWGPGVNAELVAAGIGTMDEQNVYSGGWRIWKGASSYDIYYTEQQLAGAADGTVLEGVVKGNTEEMAAAELAGNAEDAMVEGSMEVEVKTMKNQENETVEYSTLLGTSFEADPDVED